VVRGGGGGTDRRITSWNEQGRALSLSLWLASCYSRSSSLYSTAQMYQRILISFHLDFFFLYGNIYIFIIDRGRKRFDVDFTLKDVIIIDGVKFDSFASSSAVD
jgi:hypothetical protein